MTIDGEDMKIVVKDGREPLTRENLLDYNFEIQTTDDNGNTVTEDHPLSEFATLVLEDGVQSINRENPEPLHDGDSHCWRREAMPPFCPENCSH